MSLSRTARRAVAVAAGVLACATIAPAAAGAHGAGTWTIDNYRHYAGLQQEVGSDETFLITINYQAQLGVPGSCKVWANSPIEIDSIDDGEYHTMPIDEGRSQFRLGAWDMTHLMSDRGPWVFGTISQAFEADVNSYRNRKATADAIAGALQSEVCDDFEVARPSTIATLTLADMFLSVTNPKWATFRNNLIQRYLEGSGVELIRKAWGSAGVWAPLRTLVQDDRIGDPRFTMVIGVEPITVPLPNLFFPWLPARPVTLAFDKEINAYFVASQGPTGDQILTLPLASTAGCPSDASRGRVGTGRNIKQQYKGSGARYVMDVRFCRSS
jgi:hypothetical protein